MGEVILAAFVAMVLLPLMLGSFIERKWLKDVSAGDQQCPHCDTWQSACGGWAWVGNSDNPMIDFAAECGQCGQYSSWVWVGPDGCATLECLDKNTAKGR